MLRNIASPAAGVAVADLVGKSKDESETVTTVAIMQPYFLPYIGYFQLIAAVDVFIVYDNIKYTKKGWINRNRLLQNGTDAVFSLPLKKGADTLDVVQRELADDFDRSKLLNQFRGAYARAPYFSQIFPLLERIVHCEERNLFRYLHHALTQLCVRLDIRTDIRISSEIRIDHSLKAQDKVLALCHAMEADRYINAIGGREIYDRDVFRMNHVALEFIRSKPFDYPQLGAPFVPWLSIVDVMMFNTPEQVNQAIRNGYELV